MDYKWLASSIFLLFSYQLFSTNSSWTATADGNWNNNANWTPTTFPNAIDDTANFPSNIATRTVTLGIPITVGTMNFDSSTDYIIAGASTLTLQSTTTAAINNASTNTAFNSITCPLLVNTNLIMTNDSASTITFSGSISGTGTFTKEGTGTLILSGATNNPLSGAFIVNAGILGLQKTPSAPVNAINSSVQINSGGTLQLMNGGELSAAVTVTINGGTFDLNGFSENFGSLNFISGTLTQGTFFIGLTAAGTSLTMNDATEISGPLSFTVGNASYTGTTTRATISGDVNLSNNSHTFNINNGADSVDMEISGAITGATGSISMAGPGVLQFSGSTANTYGGNTFISGGQLVLAKNPGVNAIAANAAVLGGTLTLGASNQIANTSTITLTTGTFNMGGFPETIGALVYNGGTLTQGGATLTLASASTALTMRDTTISGNIALTGSGQVVFDSTNNGTATISGNIDLGGTSIAFNIANGAATTDMNISGVISNSGGLLKTGAGRLDLTGTSANTYTGPTTVTTGQLVLNKTGVNAIAGNATINGGTLTLGAAGQIVDTSTVTLSSGTFDLGVFSETIGALIFNGGTLTQGVGSILSLANAGTALTMRNTTITGNLAITGGGGVTFDATNNGTATISGNIDLGAGTISYTIANGSAATDMNVSGVISNGGLTKTGAGLLEFSGMGANTYTGLTTISAGELLLNKTGVNAIVGSATVSGGTLTLGAANQIADTSTVTLSGGTFNMGVFSETIGALIFNSGTLTQGVGTTLSLADAGTALTMRDTTISGDLSITSGGQITFDSTNNGTATISGNINLGAATISYNIANGTATTDMNVSGVISNGAVTKTGAGLLEYSGTGANTYTGLTTISAGELLLQKTAGVNAVAGNATISGGTLTLGAANQIVNTSTVTLSSGTFNMGGFADTIGTLVFNGGTLTQGSGTLSLANAVTALSMRDTTISGNLAITGGGAIVFDSTNNGTATISGNIDLGASTISYTTANGTNSTDMLISGIISNGGLTKTGLGTLELTGANTYAGGTTINAGTLLGNTTSLQGSIADNANLVFNQQTDGTFAGTLSGAGTLSKIGPAALTLSTMNSVGNTTVSAGTLIVNGTLAGGGSLIVDAGAILQGTGTITKDSTISGTLSPGNSIGTIFLVGDHILASGSTLEIELNPTTSDLVDITGTLTIQPNSTLSLIPDAGTYPGAFTYTIVQTTGGVTGTFTSITNSYPLLSGTVTYDGFNIFLTASFAPFSTVINSGNAGVVARTLDALSATPCENLTSIIDSLNMISSVSALEDALLQMQPSAFTALEITQENDALHIKDIVNNHLNQLVTCDYPEYEESTVWLTVLGSITRQNTHDQEPGFTSTSPGFLLGCDHLVGQKVRIGGGVGYTYSNVHWSQSRGHADTNTAYVALYGRIDLPWFYTGAALLGGINFYDNSRPINIPDVVNVVAKSHHQGLQGLVDLTSGLLFEWQNINFSPYVSLDYTFLKQNSFHEHGAQSLNLDVFSQRASLFVTEVGLNITSCFDSDYKQYSPFLTVGVIRVSRLKGEHIHSTMQCGDYVMDVKGYCPSRTLGKVLAGVTVQVNPIEFNFSYEGKFGDSYSDNALAAEVAYRF